MGFLKAMWSPMKILGGIVLGVVGFVVGVVSFLDDGQGNWGLAKLGGSMIMSGLDDASFGEFGLVGPPSVTGTTQRSDRDEKIEADEERVESSQQKSEKVVPREPEEPRGGKLKDFRPEIETKQTSRNTTREDREEGSQRKLRNPEESRKFDVRAEGSKYEGLALNQELMEKLKNMKNATQQQAQTMQQNEGKQTKVVDYQHYHVGQQSETLKNSAKMSPKQQEKEKAPGIKTDETPRRRGPSA